MHRHHRTIAAAFLAAVLTACGGGGGSDATEAPDSTKPNMSGNLSWSGSVTPDPATSAQALDVVVSVTLAMGSAPADSVAIPYTLRRVTSGEQVWNGSVTVTKAFMDFTGTLSTQIPAGQPVGEQSYCLVLRPADAFDFHGTNEAESCTTVTITAS